MAATKYSAYGSAVIVLATELNAISTANVSGVSGAGTGVIFDNTTNLNLLADAEFNCVFGSAPTAGTTVELHAYFSLDAATYATSLAAGATLPNDPPVGVFIINGVATTQKLQILGVTLRPGKTKFAIVNRAGVATPATGTTVTLYPYSFTTI
jgi:hypothetical protein